MLKTEYLKEVIRMSNCKKNLSKEEIFLEFGKDDDMGACNGCDNLTYSGGMMTCKVLEESGENNDN